MSIGAEKMEVETSKVDDGAGEGRKKSGQIKRPAEFGDEKEKVVEVLLAPDNRGKSKSLEGVSVKNLGMTSNVKSKAMSEGKVDSKSSSSGKKKQKMEFSVQSLSVNVSKPKKMGGWAAVNNAFNPSVLTATNESFFAPSVLDISSKPTDYLMSRSSLVSEELNREHAGRTNDFGNDLMNRIQQKRKMAQLLMKQIHKEKGHEHDPTIAKPNVVLMAFMSFWNSAKRQRGFLIPKDRAAWLEFLVQLCRRKTKIQYLTNKELKKVIIRTRPNLAAKKHALTDDPDCPECFFWNENQVADWVESIGFPNLREAFLMNCITGRRLVTVDVNALRQMGLKYFDEMKTVAGKIREILGLPRPNILRAIMRIVPFEQYLKKRVNTGKSYDLLNFEKFCQENDYDYSELKTNKNAVIPCTTEVFMVPTGILDDDVDMEKEGSEEEEVSLINAPTVEFVVRNSIIRNKIVARIIEEILKNALNQGKKGHGKGVKETMKESLLWGLSEIGLDDELRIKERMEFASSVAQALLIEIHKTSAALEDLDQIEKYTGEKVTPEKLEYLKDVAEQFMEDVAPIAAILALGQLDLEVIFREADGMEEYIDGVIDEAQRAVDEQCEEAEEFLTEVCDEAYQIVQQMRAGFTDGQLLPFQINEIVQDIIEELLTNAYIIDAVERGSFEGETIQILAESKESEIMLQLEKDKRNADRRDRRSGNEGDQNKDQEKKGSAVTNLQTVIDNEVKIGLMQMSTDKSNKDRKKRTELTVSDSSSRGRIKEGSPLTDGYPPRKVGSDTSLLRSPLRPITASVQSIKSNSTGEFSVDSYNLRAQYSEAFKQIAKERIQRLTEKSKLYMSQKVKVKAHSLPQSPLTDEENLRQTVSDFPMKDSYHPGGVERPTSAQYDHDTHFGKDHTKDTKFAHLPGQKHVHLTSAGHGHNEDMELHNKNAVIGTSAGHGHNEDMELHNKKAVIGTSAGHDHEKSTGAGRGNRHSMGSEKQHDEVHAAVKNAGLQIIRGLMSKLNNDQFGVVQTKKVLPLKKDENNKVVDHPADSHSGKKDEIKVADLPADNRSGKKEENKIFDLPADSQSGKKVENKIVDLPADSRSGKKDENKVVNLPAGYSSGNEDEQKDKEKKKNSMTSPQTVVDKEVKIGVMQLSMDKSNKDRKQRTELTVSDSLSKGRIKEGSPLADGYPARKVGSDSSLLKSPLKPISTSAHSLKTNSTMEFTVDNTNMRPEDSEAKKGIQSVENEKTKKTKLLMAQNVKAYSVPNSPLTDGENLRKTVSDTPKKESFKAKDVKRPSGAQDAEVTEDKSLSKDKTENIIENVKKVVEQREEKSETSLISVPGGSQKTMKATESDMSVVSVEDDDAADNEDDGVTDDRILRIRQLIKEKKLHRRQLVEHWAHEMDGSGSNRKNSRRDSVDPEEHARIMRITADQIVSDIVQLALTHMLLEAESGKDVENILAALREIQVSDIEDDHAHTVILWEPHIPELAKSLAMFKNKNKFNKRNETGSHPANSADSFLPTEQPKIVSRRFNKLTKNRQNDDETEITRL